MGLKYTFGKRTISHLKYHSLYPEFKCMLLRVNFKTQNGDIKEILEKHIRT